MAFVSGRPKSEGKDIHKASYTPEVVSFASLGLAGLCMLSRRIAPRAVFFRRFAAGAQDFCTRKWTARVLCINEGTRLWRTGARARRPRDSREDAGAPILSAVVVGLAGAF
jgi:hypothetical protein